MGCHERVLLLEKLLSDSLGLLERYDELMTRLQEIPALMPPDILQAILTERENDAKLILAILAADVKPNMPDPWGRSS